MAKMIQMVVVLVGISLISGLALGGLNKLTEQRANDNVLRFKKIPAVAGISEGISGKLEQNARAALEDKLLAEKKELAIEGGEPVVFFVLEKDGAPYAVAIEDSAKGFGGELGVMVGVNLETGDLAGIGITTHSETPGVGTRVTEDSFTMQFRGISKDSVFKVKKDGGDLDAVTGATVSSRAVAEAIGKALQFYQEHEAEIKDLVKQ